MKKLLSAVAAATILAGSAIAADVQSDAGAKIVAPLQISNVTALYFGTVAPSTSAADTVIVDAAGNKTCGAELTCLSSDHTAAEFSVSGDPERAYTIDLPSSISISNGNGGTMTVNNFTGSKANGTLSTGGTDSFDVGGTLNVAANQATGEYTGTFTVTVEYQ
ncbi:MAG: DUF4402 domain-containing protein [Pseudomonadota bacterium]